MMVFDDEAQHMVLDKRVMVFAFASIGCIIINYYVLSLPKGFVAINPWGRTNHGNYNPAELSSSRRSLMLNWMFILSTLFLFISVSSALGGIEFYFYGLGFLVLIIILFLSFLFETCIFAARGLFLTKGYCAMVALTLIILFDLILFDRDSEDYSNKLYNFFRCLEFATVIACFALGSEPVFSLNVVITHFVGIFLLSHLVTTLLVSNINHSFMLYFLISAAILTLSEILLGSHSISLFASSPAIQHVLSISGIFLLCFYLCVAANLMFSCFMNRTPVISGYEIIYTFAAICMSATSIYVKDNLAKNPTVRTLFLVIFSLSSTLGLFFAFRLAKKIAGIESDKGGGSDRALPLANALGGGDAPANAQGGGGAPANPLGGGGAAPVI